MNVAIFGRQCIRQTSRRVPYQRCQWRNHCFGTRGAHWWPFRAPLRARGNRNLLAKASVGAAAGAGVGAAAATTTLNPTAFVRIEEAEWNDDKTGEQHMLDASRAEIEAELPDFVAGSKGIRRSVYYYLDTYIWEPICTGLRFFHLMFIFVPVIVTSPVVWLGSPNPERDNERAGTLWWYGFLVGSMERAGAAFIKVGIAYSAQSWTMGADK